MYQNAKASQRNAAPAEFVCEMIEGNGDSSVGMNVHSCDVCYAFGKHDAMDLVLYICAGDGVVSDALNQGLRRTGTIALGTHHRDFRYKRHGKSEPVRERFSDRIRLTGG